MRAHALFASPFLLLSLFAGGACQPGQEGPVGVATSAFVSDVADPLDGLMMVSKCGTQVQASVCLTTPPSGTCPPKNDADPALSGALIDRTFLLKGFGGAPYKITLHIQGEVESKGFIGGSDPDSGGVSPHLNGFRTGGAPTTDSYSSFMLRITGYEFGATTDYFLNSLQGPGASQHTTYGIDYKTDIVVNGMSVVRMVLADPNCMQIRNCGPVANDGNTCFQPLLIRDIEPSAIAHNPGFDFNSPFDGQWLVMTVTDVVAL
jgi:hypothetical protein